MGIHIVEVGPRDGLQNEPQIVPTEMKVAFVDALSLTGLVEIEVSSFVSSRWVPQLGDAAEVFARIARQPGVLYTALVPNERGLDGAIEARADKVAVFTAASETFNQKNINATIAESIERFRPVCERSPVPVRGYVSTAFHCPFEGEVRPEAVVTVVSELLALGVSEISLGDTIGKATPDQVSSLLDETLRVCPAEQTALHFHDTFGRAIENVRAGYRAGIRIFDASAGGLGGCPYAPGAPGNLATEDLVRAFADEAGVRLDALDEAISLIRSAIRSRHSS